MTSQSQIAIESHAGKLLRMMVQFGHCPCERITPAVKWLIKRQFAYRSYGKLYITEPNPRAKTAGTSGREYYESLCQNPAVTVSLAVWKAEVQSQLAVVTSKKSGFSVTRESTITRACIPGPTPTRTPRSPEDMVADMERDLAAQAKWCEKLDVTPGELRELVIEGRIKVCGGCSEEGVFDGVRKLCRKCLGKKYNK